MHHYVTYFDTGYLTRGLSLIKSIRQHGDTSPITVVALDTLSSITLGLLSLPNVRIVTSTEIERRYPELIEVKSSRSNMEYVFTRTPFVIDFVMREDLVSDESIVIYLDADLYFLDSPELAVDALGRSSVGIIEHKYPPKLEEKLSKYGKYNVGWVAFRKDNAGTACLKWWKKRCLEWCGDYPSDGRYADQGYLNEFPELFSQVRVLSSVGMNLAPWNSHGVKLTKQGDHYEVNGQQLVFFHVHGLRTFHSRFVTAELIYRNRLSREIRDAIYIPYATSIARLDGLLQGTAMNSKQNRRGSGIRGFLFSCQKMTLNIFSVLIGNSVRPASGADQSNCAELASLDWVTSTRKYVLPE